MDKDKAYKRQRVTLKNKRGKTLVDLSLIWAIIIALAAPELAALVLVAVLLEFISVDVREVSPDPEPEQHKANQAYQS